MLAGRGTAAREGVVYDLGVDLLGARQVPFVIRIDGEDGVVVSVADVSEDGAVEAMRLDGIAGVAQRLGKVGDGDADVGGHRVLSGVEIPYGEARLVPGLPQPLPPGLVRLELERPRALGLGDPARNLHVALDADLRAVELQKEGRLDGVGGAFVGVYRLDGTGVHQL